MNTPSPAVAPFLPSVSVAGSRILLRTSQGVFALPFGEARTMSMNLSTVLLSLPPSPPEQTKLARCACQALISTIPIPLVGRYELPCESCKGSLAWMDGGFLGYIAPPVDACTGTVEVKS